MRWISGKQTPWLQQSRRTPVLKQDHLVALELNVVATLRRAFVTSQVENARLPVHARSDGCLPLGCGNNPFALGAREFYGPGMTVDTSKPFTVITQFKTINNTAAGTLNEIRRMYIQNGKLIDNAVVTNLSGKSVQMPGTITEDFCTARNASTYLRLGGMAEMGKSLNRGMVLIFSLWNSDGDFMNCTTVPLMTIMLNGLSRY